MSREAVNHPSHYNRGGFEVISVIDYFGLNFNMGNALKYLVRAGYKESSSYHEDIRKATFYLRYQAKARPPLLRRILSWVDSFIYPADNEYIEQLIIAWDCHRLGHVLKSILTYKHRPSYDLFEAAAKLEELMICKDSYTSVAAG